MSTEKITSSPFSGAVVGTIHSAGALKAALKLPKGAVDFLELRLDSFVTETGNEEKTLRKKIPTLPAPLLVTARDPKEGAVNPLSWKRRLGLYREFLEHASVIDVELRNAAKAQGLLNEAHRAGVKVVFSFHDFKAMPSLDRLAALKLRAQDAGGDVFKVAAMAKTPAALSTLVELMAAHRSKEIALAAMGMGPLGKTSRLVMGRLGSVLNYGFLDRLQVPGQWPAETLKRLLAELSV